MTRKEPIVAQGPAVVFATQEAAEQIVTDMKARYDQAAHFAEARGTVAIQKGEEIRQLEAEIKEREAWVVQKSGEMRQAEADSRKARDVAKGLADLLAMAGVHIPPYGSELSHNPDGALRNFDAAHEELNRSGGHS